MDQNGKFSKRFYLVLPGPLENSGFFCFFLKLTLLNVLFQELVTKVFQQMWFTPLKNDENSDVLVKRVVHMTDVVSQRVNVNC